MIFALDSSRNRIKANKNIFGVCPNCHNQLIPRCGEVYVHHWAHKKSQECDDWSEAENSWHIYWKELFGPESADQVVGDHLVDAIGTNNIVFEFQYSSIPEKMIRFRENYYKKMIWIVRLCNPDSPSKIKLIKKKNSLYILANQIPKAFQSCKMPVFFHIEFCNLFELRDYREAYKIKNFLSSKDKLIRNILFWGKSLSSIIIKGKEKTVWSGKIIPMNKFIKKYIPKAT